MAKSTAARPTTMELQCPSCNDLLELDAGFAGGVCRCSACGTLMTVPADPGLERAERLSRPDRPDAPPTSGTPGAAAPPDAADSDVEILGPASAPVPAPAPGPYEYVTASGRRIRVDAQRAIPTARKRKRQIIRATTAVAFCAILAVVIGLCVYLMLLLLAPGTKPAGTDGRDKPFGYDPKVNPLNAEPAGFLALPVSAKTALVIEASGLSKEWMGAMKQVLRLTAKRVKPGTALQVVFWSDVGAKAFPADGPKALAAGEQKELAAFLDDITPLRTADPVPGVAKALAGKPEQIIFVTASRLEDAPIAAIAGKLASATVRFDVLELGVGNPKLEELPGKHQGRYVRMPAEQVQTWVDGAKK